MTHKGYESTWLGPNNNCEPSNHPSLNQFQNNNNLKVTHEKTQGFPTYEYPAHFNIYTSPTINTAGSHHDRLNHQYSVQNPHQISQQWLSSCQSKNSSGFVSGIQHQASAQTQSTELHYFKAPPSWSNHQNLYSLKNPNVNCSQFYVGNDNHKTSNCSNRAQVNETYISKTPTIRVRDVYSVNNTVYQGTNSNVCEPQRKEKTNYFENPWVSHKRVENNVIQRPYENILAPQYKSLNKGYDYCGLLMHQSGTQVESVLKSNSHQQNKTINSAWVPEGGRVNLTTNGGNKNDGTLIASTQNSGQSGTDLGKFDCVPKILEKVLLGNKRMKISPRRHQLISGGNVGNSRSFLESQSSSFKSGYLGSDSSFSLSRTSSLNNEMAYPVSNTQTPNKNHVQKNQAVQITTAECDSSICITLSDVRCTDNQSSNTVSSGGNSIASYVNNSGKNKTDVSGLLNESLLVTTPNLQCSPALKDSYMPDSVCYGVKNTRNDIPVVINEVFAVPNSKIDETNIKSEAVSKCSKSNCSEAQEKNEYLKNQQGGNSTILKELFCNEQSSVIQSQVKKEACTQELSEKCSTISYVGENNPMDMEEFFSCQKFDPGEPCDPVEVIEKENATTSNENTTLDVPEESCQLEHKYENKINREKLDRLIEFLAGDCKSVERNTEKNSQTSTIGSSKRKGEDDVLNNHRRKLRKSSIVKNKNETRETTSLILYKPCRKESKCLPEAVSQENNLDNENKVKNKVDEIIKNKTKMSSEVEEANEKPESDTKDLKELSSRQSVAKENFERKKEIKRKKRDNEENSTILSEKQTGKCEDTEETGIISTVRAFQKLKYHYCMSCNLNSSNDSFWINVVSGELRCLNCFKKMAIRAEKTKSKNVLENSVHEPKVADNNHASLDHAAEKKREEKNDPAGKTNVKETTAKIETKQENEKMKNSDREIKKNSKENHKKHSRDEDSTKGKEKLTSLETSSSDKQAKKKEKKSVFSCEENSTEKSCSGADKTTHKTETKSKKHKEKNKMTDRREREIDHMGPEKKNVLMKIVEKQTESKCKNNQKEKHFKDLVEQTKQKDNPESKLKEKLGKGNSIAESKKKCLGDRKPNETPRKKEKKEATVSEGDLSNLLEKLYEKTKEISRSLFCEG